MVTRTPPEIVSEYHYPGDPDWVLVFAIGDTRYEYYLTKGAFETVKKIAPQSAWGALNYAKRNASRMEKKRPNGASDEVPNV
jgi:hypothetical protein